MPGIVAGVELQRAGFGGPLLDPEGELPCFGGFGVGGLKPFEVVALNKPRPYRILRRPGREWATSAGVRAGKRQQSCRTPYTRLRFAGRGSAGEAAAGF